MTVFAEAQSLPQKYQVSITAAGNTITADEPVDSGGQNTGLNPYELLLASLGSCTAVTLRMYAERKQWPLEQVHVKLALDKFVSHTNISRQITLTGALDETQRERLLSIANACPVHKILSHPIHIHTEIV